MFLLEAERLYLRYFRKDDWRDLYEYLSDEKVVAYEPYPVFSEDECKKEALNRSTNHSFIAVCLKDNHKLIGNLYFHQQDPKEFMTWEIGYVFHPSYYGKGLATEACKRLLQYAFEDLGVHRIIALCNPENTPSWHLLERLSMRREGHFKKPAFFQRSMNGQPLWHDAYQSAILVEEYMKN